jgi:hypothetical protein
MFQKKQFQIFSIFLLSLIAVTVQAGVIRGNSGAQLVPTGKGWGEHLPPDAAASTNSSPALAIGNNGIQWHGGLVMHGTTNVYYIWYGDWSGNSAPTILETFANSIGGSPYYNINTTYWDYRAGVVTQVSNDVAFQGSAYDNYSRGTSINDRDVKGIVTDAINNGSVPSDPNGVYFVLTSADVGETSGFCTQYCGWHTHRKINNIDIKFSFVGNAERCPNACSVQTTVSPNDNIGADAMASVIAHELEETVTDPRLNAWYDTSGYENADKCAWTYGTTYNAGNGSTANMNLGGLDFLIQQNWVNANGGDCVLSYP